MKLREMIEQLTAARTEGNMDVDISGLSMHSRTVRPGELFVCVPGIPGFQEDRHPFAEEAVRKGAAAIVAERRLGLDVPTVLVSCARHAMAVMACHFYGYPSTELKLIGVTGTNGKTTTGHMIEAILREAGHRTGLMGNLGTKIGEDVTASDTNTQEPHKLQASLRSMRDRQTDYAVMEVTSQGLAMGRVLGCEFRTAVFTNLTQDHLDFHGTMERYMQDKGMLFSSLGSGFSRDESKRKYAVLNADDPASAYFRRITAAHVVTYGVKEKADVMARNVKLAGGCAAFELVSFAGTIPIRLRMVGAFNVYNALAAIASALVEGVSLEAIRTGLERLRGVPGRMETVDAGQNFLVLADYAHTPDGLDNALSTVKRFAEGKIITVFGCGGDRDREKRPVMGRLAAQYSDFVVVTSDNPRGEDPAAIMADIERGLTVDDAGRSEYELIADRRQAIERAIGLAGDGDVVLIAGKGHETVQITRDGTVHFDDREEARSAIVRKWSG